MGIIKTICLLIRAFLVSRLSLAAENIALRQQVAVYRNTAILLSGGPGIKSRNFLMANEYGIISRDREEAATLVRYLEDQVAHGYGVLTWNGLGFDFVVLAEESGMLQECRALALSHVDMMSHVC